MNLQAIYVMWLREMKKAVRSKGRIIGSLGTPFFFLALLGFGFSSVKFSGVDASYINFLVPGILGMVLLFNSVFAGVSVIWDRQFGFLKEIMVSPVDRLSIMVGRILGGMTTAVFQAILMLVISLFFGFSITSISGLFLSIVYMVFVSLVFVSIGVIFASKMEDMQGFYLIMNFFVFPLFLLSGAVFPITNLPAAVAPIVYLDPLTYAVDGIRGSLIGLNSIPLVLDLGILAGFLAIFIWIGNYLFGKMEVN